MKINENERKWMEMNENEWKWMKMNENEWKCMKWMNKTWMNNSLQAQNGSKGHLLWPEDYFWERVY